MPATPPTERPPQPLRKWVFRFLLFFPVVVVVTPFVAGRFLPEDYHGAAVAHLDAPPRAVWDAMLDRDANPVTGRLWKGTQVLPDEDGMPVWVEDMGESQVTVRTLEAVEPERLVRFLEDSVVPMTSRMTFELEPDGTGTRVTAQHDLRIADGTWHVPPFRFTVWLMGSASGALKEYLANTAASIEASVTFEGDE